MSQTKRLHKKLNPVIVELCSLVVNDSSIVINMLGSQEIMSKIQNSRNSWISLLFRRIDEDREVTERV